MPPPQAFIAKFEEKGHVRLNEERKTVDKATLKQITSGKFQVNSVDPKIFDDPYVIPIRPASADARMVGSPRAHSHQAQT